MKNLLQGISCLLLICACISTNAQTPPVKEPDTNRPSLFKQLPQRATCRINDLESLIDMQVGQHINLFIADNMLFVGTVSSVASKFENTIKSVVIRSTNYEGAALTFSRITKEDGSTYFTGRIISFKHDDAFEMVFENGQYAFVKKGFYDMVND